MAGVGEALRSLREAAGLTQEQLAERAGLSARTISDVERGLRRRLYPDTAGRLADALGLAGADRVDFVEVSRGRGGPGGLDAGFRRRFVAWHLARVTELARDVGNEELWYAVLDADEANLQVALRWAEEGGDVESLLGLATGLWQYWLARGALSTGRHWLERGLAVDPPASGTARMRALWGLGWLAHQQGDDPAAARAAELLTALAAQDGDPAARRNAATATGMVELAAARPDRAVAVLEHALALAEELESPWLLATSRLNLGIAAVGAGDTARARRLVEAAAGGYALLGDERFGARCLGYLGLAALAEGHLDEARRQFGRSLAAFEALGEPSGTAEALTGLSALAAAGGHALRAATLGGAAERLRESFSGRPLPVERRLSERLLAQARREVSPDAWSSAWTAGRALRLDEALELAAQGASTVTAPGTTSTVSGSAPMRSPSA